MPNEDCLALEEEENVLSIVGFDSFLISIDLQSEFLGEMVKAYEKKDDESGKDCQIKMSSRIEAIMRIFKHKVLVLENENSLVEHYLKNFALSRNPRFEIGSLALIMSILSFLLTTSNLVISQTQITSINNRLDSMSKLIDTIYENQQTLYTNVEFLREQNKFLGGRTMLLASHLNEVTTIYSCQFLGAHFETMVLSLENRLKGIIEGLMSRKLNENIIDRLSLEHITNDNYFRDSIFLLNPTLLYELGKIDLIALKGNKLNVLLSFPNISNSYDYKKVNLIESPSRLVLKRENFETTNSFLYPKDMNLSTLEKNMHLIRSSGNCIRTRHFLACDVQGHMNFRNSLCLRGLLEGVNIHCLSQNVINFDYTLEYSNAGCLINMNSQVHIENFVTHEKMHMNEKGQKKCIYLSYSKNLKIVSPFRYETLFPKLMHFDTVSPKIQLSHSFETMSIIPNVTFPPMNFTNVYKPIDFTEKETSDKVAIIAIAVSCSLILFIMIVCIIRKFCKINGSITAGGLFGDS